MRLSSVLVVTSSLLLVCIVAHSSCNAARIVSSSTVNKVTSLPNYGPLNQPQYTGYLQANATLDAFLFYWFVPARTNADTLPLLVWLQGGPGCSSMLGLFNELGPFYVK